LKRARIENVAVAAAIRDEEVVGVGRRRNRNLAGLDDADDAIARPGVLDPYSPRALAWRRAEQILIAAGVDESVQSAPAQDARGNIDGEAFGDATEIQLDALTREMSRVRAGIEEHVAIIDERPHGGELRFRR